VQKRAKILKKNQNKIAKKKQIENKKRGRSKHPKKTGQ